LQKEGNQAKPYQVRQVLNIILKTGAKGIIAGNHPWQARKDTIFWIKKSDPEGETPYLFTATLGAFPVYPG